MHLKVQCIYIKQPPVHCEEHIRNRISLPFSVLSAHLLMWGRPRENREGWPLLTIETGVNGDSKSTNERGPSLVGSLGLSCRYERFFVLIALVHPIFFSSP